MADDESTVVWGTARAWSKKLGIAEQVLKARCAGLPTQRLPKRRPRRPAE